MGLVLARREMETLHIGREIKITVVQINSDRVKLHIEAPPTVAIVRGEIMTHPVELGQDVIEYDRTLDCGSLGQVVTHGTSGAIKAAFDTGEHNDK